jgi:hypothetical protein
MTISVKSSEAVVGGATNLPVSSFFTVSSGSDPAYLVVSALDRNEYTAAATGQTGSFVGNGNTLNFTNQDGDGREASIIFTYQASSGQYVNSTFGSLSSLTYDASGSLHDVTSISIYGASSLSLAQSVASDAYGAMSADASGYIASVSVVTDPHFSGTVPTQATPDGIAAVAQSYVGDAWNMEGCWVLASTIAAESGASLPVTSTALDIAGQANGEWYVAYDGPVSSNSNWTNLVQTGDMIAFVPAGGGGHITTCVSGSGSSAELIDNITYEGYGGTISNSANDGSSNDIIVESEHSAAQEFSGANPADAVVYALDTPVVTIATNTTTGVAATVGTARTIGNLISAKDPEGKAITQYQLYDSSTNGSFVAGGKTLSGHSAVGAVTIAGSSLSSLALSYSGAGSDTVEVRAYNGSYWGDWSSFSVTASAPVAKAPVLGAATAAQTWAQGAKISLALPATLFTDPQKQTLTYSASTTSGALPSWLTFNAATRTFSGTVPKGSFGALPIVVTATDSSGLSNAETFTATIPALAPTLSLQTATQTWTEGSTVNDTLSSHTFSDPQGETVTLKATLSSGAALPSWLSFNASTGTFSGTAPSTAQNLSIKVTATNTSGLSISDSFAADITHASTAGFALSDWSISTPAVTASVAPPPDVLPPAAMGIVAPSPTDIIVPSFNQHA